MTTTDLDLHGMSCASCAARVEGALNKLDAGGARRAAHAVQVEVRGGHGAVERAARRSRATPTTASIPAAVARSRVNSNSAGS